MTRKQLKRRIRECEAEIETIKTLPYYSIFKRDAEREEDLNALQEKLYSLQSQLSVTVGSHTVPIAIWSRSTGISEATPPYYFSLYKIKEEFQCREKESDPRVSEV